MKNITMNVIKMEGKVFLLCKDKIKDLDEYKEKYLYPAYLWTVFTQVYKDKIKNLQPNIWFFINV